MIQILMLLAALAGAGGWIFVYFGHYWWMYWQQTRQTVAAPRRPHWRSENAAVPVVAESVDNPNEETLACGCTLEAPLAEWEKELHMTWHEADREGYCLRCGLPHGGRCGR